MSEQFDFHKLLDTASQARLDAQDAYKNEGRIAPMIAVTCIGGAFAAVAAGALWFATHFNANEAKAAVTDTMADIMRLPTADPKPR